MMGMQAAPERLFYDFCLEDRVPAGHLLRRIDGFLDLSELRATLRPFYSRIGRASIDPELMIRMLIVGYCFAIRSERRLCEEVDLNLAYRWFCGLGLDGRVPDHSTFSLISLTLLRLHPADRELPGRAISGRTPPATRGMAALH